MVVEDTSHHLLVLAGAGTGKTNTLACRTAYLIENGVPANRILCLTFTNRACKELVERVALRAGPAANQVVARTVHSFCVWLLRQAPAELLEVGQEFGVCDSEDSLELLGQVCLEQLGRSIPQASAQILQRFTELVKSQLLAQPHLDLTTGTAWTFAHHRQEIEALCTPRRGPLDLKFFHFLEKYGASFLRFYQRKLHQNNLLDFSDLLIQADRMLEHPACQKWRDWFSYVQIDEVQDVSLGEYQLLSKLWGNAKVLLCGDFNQTIYQWRGSDPTGLSQRFIRDFSPVVVEFTRNYRSSPGLLALASNFRRNAFGQKETLQPVPKEDVAYQKFDSMEQEARWIYRQIQALPTKEYSKVAILVRNNKTCQEMQSLLQALCLEQPASIEFMLADQFRLLKRPEIKDLLACASLISNPRDGEAFRRVLSRLVPEAGEALVNQMVQDSKEGGGASLTDMIDQRCFLGDFFQPLLTAQEQGQVVVFDVESTGTNVYEDDIIQMAAIRLDSQGQESGRFLRFLKPSKPVGDSQRVHGFSDAFLAEHGVSPAQALEEFLELVKGRVIVGHNVGFDMAITRSNLKRLGIGQPLDNLWYDTLDLSRRFLKKAPNHKLETLARLLQTPHQPSHDAMDDILATADLLGLLTKTYLLPGTSQRRLFYTRYLPQLRPVSQKIQEIKAQNFSKSSGLLQALMNAFSLGELYREQPQRLERLETFLSFVQEQEQEDLPLERQLSNLLELCALSASELDHLSRSSNRVVIITAHQSKGCEFDYVFLPVLQEGVFPSFQAVQSGDFSEERRVFYVCITRAKRRLFLSWSRYNQNLYPCQPSRFLEQLGLDTL